MPKKLVGADLIKWVLARHDELESERSSYIPTWNELSKFILPMRHPVQQTAIIPGTMNEGVSPIDVYDAHPIVCNNRLASLLSATLTPSSMPWFRLLPEEEQLCESRAIMEALAAAEGEMYLALRLSKFYSAINEAWLDLPALGTAFIFMEPGLEIPFRIKTRHIREVKIAENEDGITNSFFRSFYQTSKQLVEMFGEGAVGDTIRRNYNDGMGKGQFDQYLIVHGVFKNAGREQGKEDPTNKEYRSVYVAQNEEHIISDSGYSHFPMVAPRWLRRSAEVYGHGVGIDQLADIKTLNQICKDVLIAAEIAANPRLMVSSESIPGTIDMTPGGVTVYDAAAGGRMETIPLGDIRPALERIEALHQQLLRAFYVDQLQMKDLPRQSATEVMERKEEDMGQLAPTVARLEDDFLQPLISLGLHILIQKGQIRLPEELYDSTRNLRVRAIFTSALARAQKMLQTRGIIQTMQTIGPLATYYPEALDNYDADAAVRIINDAMFLPVGIEREEREVKKIRADRQKLQEEAKRQAAVQTEADIDTTQAQASERRGKALQAIQGGRAE